MPTDPVDAVFLDMDGTLCEYRQSSAELLARAFDRLDVDPFFTAETYRNQLFSQIVTDETKAERREQAFITLAELDDRDPAVGRRLAAVYASMRDHRDVEPLPGALDALDSLRERYDLALVTNGGPEMQDPKLAALDVEDAFDVIVYGGYDTTPKPEPGPFHEALYALDATPGRVVHVGNSVRFDVWGADAAGIKSALLRPDGDEPATAPDYLLRSMADLQDPPWR
ncbi:HAD family hydrolase [Halorientalis brevis]|uniref:HAD family hydrolase n=1 Tax=Halorientalis brevis TaxID=1126241 RepID=A0ABD6C7B5_9EURY|nr:HAD family hydrolase [Halorientalis brevis]